MNQADANRDAQAPPENVSAFDAVYESGSLEADDLRNPLESFERIDAIFDALAEGDEEKLDEALLCDLTDESELFAHQIQQRFLP